LKTDNGIAISPEVLSLPGFFIPSRGRILLKLEAFLGTYTADGSCAKKGMDFLLSIKYYTKGGLCNAQSHDDIEH